MPDPITRTAGGLDLSDRIVQSQVVAASPATNAITTICSVTWNPPDNPSIVMGVEVQGWCSFTTGTNGVTAKLDIRRTSSAGTLLVTTGLLTVVATQIYAPSVQVLDTTATVPGQVWVLCLTIGSGSAASTVSACQLYVEVI